MRRDMSPRTHIERKITADDIYTTKRIPVLALRLSYDKLMSVISPVQFRYHEGSTMGNISMLRWEGFVEKVGFDRAWSERVKE